MEISAVVEAYFVAWNAHDAAAVAATFVEGGTYCDPVSGEVMGQAIADYVTSLVTGFPDLAIEIRCQGQVDPNTVAAQWVMRGTNTGLYKGMPPTGRQISITGADFIVLESGGIRSVVGYFDSVAVPHQLGLQVIVQPRSMGPIGFGNSVATHANKAVIPGAFTLTSLQSRSDQEAETVREYSRRIFMDATKMQGFVGMLTAGVGGRFYTATAWESVEDPRQIYQSGAHNEMMDKFYNADFSAGGVFGVWVPAHLSPLLVRCTQCKSLNDYMKSAGKCGCGVDLPSPPPYW